MAQIALAGGGTGGHVYPAIAIGEVLRERGHTVLYYGDGGRLEARVAPKHGYAFRSVRAMQYPRSGNWGKLRFAMNLLRATLATRKVLKADKVALVLGVGGYISAPTVLAAWSLGLRRVVHESNVVPGLANKLCAKVANVVLLNFEATADRIGGKTQLRVGMPVNQSVLNGDRVAAATHYGLDPVLPVVLFVGGSLGAARINELAVAAGQQKGRAYQVLHLCGDRFLDAVAAQYGGVPEGVKLVGYEHQMGLAYALATVVVCRSGSSTLAEICAVGLPAILIPSPHVAENHQEANARGLEAAGAATVVVEAGWDVSRALQTLTQMLSDPSGLSNMSLAARSLAKLDAAAAAADAVEEQLR
jgi:UDP-N-acetylglucosamine--N-acetylmuramyl-(pentapeptide) pyrophosphoryl-undecaprenol N-acetylglucosamine transferase